MNISICNGRLIDPANGIDTHADLHIAEGLVAGIGDAPAGFTADSHINAEGRIVCPGLVDLRARLREPGGESRATIASETAAAAAAGITTLACPPDPTQPIDSPAVVDLIRHRARQAGHCRVLPLGALTQGLAGQQLAEMATLKQAGCIGVSNGLQAVENTAVMRRAMEYAASQGLTVFLHAEDPWLAAGGCAHEGAVSVRLGLTGIPVAAETIAVARELQLIEQTGVRAHFCHLSSARAVQMVARARYDGLPVSADVAAHQLYLTDMDIGYFDTHCHLRPPLRTQRDREGLRQGLCQGTVDAICSDHQPLGTDHKLAPFPASEPGISALETLLPLTLRLADEGLIGLSDAIARVTQRPAEILGLLEDGQGGRLGVGDRADVCVFDPEPYWELRAEDMVSTGRNTPFIGWELKGRVDCTLMAGELTYHACD